MLHRVACVQMTSGTDLPENLREVKIHIKKAAEQGAQLVVLPEMFCLMGVDQLDKVKHKEKIGQGPVQDFLSEQALRHHLWLVGGTIPIVVPDHPDKVYAACLLYNDQGKQVAAYYKIHLFDVCVSQSGETYAESQTTQAGETVVVVPTPFGKLGLAVCYDVRFPELFRQMTEKGAELVSLPSAFTLTTGALHWDVLVRARAIENQMYLLAACQTGTHFNGRKTYGHSMIVTPEGEVQACLGSEQDILMGEINLDSLNLLRKEFPALSHRRLN